MESIYKNVLVVFVFTWTLEIMKKIIYISKKRTKFSSKS